MGLARTGTTVVSEAVQQAVGARHYLSEPRTIDPFHERALLGTEGVVAKIIFEHWSDRPNLRRAVVANECALRFDRRVFVMRDPRDELISRLHFFILSHIDGSGYDPVACGRWLDLLRRKEAAPRSVPVKDLIAGRETIFGKGAIEDIGKNRNYFGFVSGLGPRKLVLRYEDFVRGERAALAEYLGCDSVEDTVQPRFPHRRRTADAQNWRRYFTPEDVAHFRPEYEPVLAAAGYSDWTLDPVDRLDPETGSAYVERLIAIARERKRRRWWQGAWPLRR